MSKRNAATADLDSHRAPKQNPKRQQGMQAATRQLNPYNANPHAQLGQNPMPNPNVEAATMMLPASMASASGNVPVAASTSGAATQQKKSRTNTPWTPAEELRLKNMRDEGRSWAEIAKTFPNRTEGSVKKHWYKDMHYAEFAEDESAALLNAIREYETNKWKVIGQKVNKPAKACEQYAKEHFGNKL